MNIHNVKKNLPWFQRERREQTDLAFEIANAIQNEGARYIGVDAPPKSGKREAVFICSEIFASQKQSVKHFYLTGFYRADIVKQQHPQYKQYGINVLYCNTLKNSKKSVQEVFKHYAQYEKIIIHYDESDWGTSKEGAAKYFFEMLKLQINKKICICKYSASNEELKLSGMFDNTETAYFKFVPHKNYRGSSHFLKKNCIKKPEPFYDMETEGLTQQGEQLIDSLIDGDGVWAVLRLTGTFSMKGDKKIISKIDHFENNSFLLNELAAVGVRVLFVHKEKKFDWIEELSREIMLLKATGGKNKLLIVINQMCSRSTEITGHKDLAWWHEHRSETSTYSTAIQSVGRCFHYDEEGFVFPIYANIEDFQLDAGEITMEQYGSNNKRSLSPRAGKTISKCENETLVLNYGCYESLKDVPEGYKKYKNGQTYWTLSDNNTSDQAKRLMNGWYGVEGDDNNVGVIHVDDYNDNFKQSWEEMIKKNPEWKGKYLTPMKPLEDTEKSDRQANHYIKDHHSKGSMYANSTNTF